MELNHHPKLAASEIAALWSQYLNDSAAICFNKHMLAHLKDQQIKDIFTYAISLGEQHLEKIKEFFNAEGFAIPIGFTEHDVTPETEPLFTDNLCLFHINIMSIHGCHGYSGAVTTSARQDVREYFTQCLTSAVELCNRTKDLLLEKGLYQRPPSLIPPKKAEFAKEEQFLAGWIGDVRPLSCIEITDLYFNLKKSTLAKAVTLAFSQVAKDKKVRQFLSNAVETKSQHIKQFYEVLNQEHLPAPSTLDAEITNSTTSPFSEKLMVFHVGFLFSTAMIYYGTGFASSPRRDLSPKYLGAITDDAKVGKEWMDLMLENEWLEQPPLAGDPEELAKQEK